MYEFDAEEAVRIARWFIVTRPRLKRLAMWHGGVNDVVNESILNLCKNSNGLANYTLSSCVTRNVIWAIARMTKRRMRQDEVLECAAVARNTWVDAEQEQCAISKEVAELVQREVALLSYREFSIVTARMDGQTLEEVGVHHKVTRARAREIQMNAMRKLRPKLEKLWSECFTNEVRDVNGDEDD